MTEHDSVIPAGGSGTLKATMKTTFSQKGRVSKSISLMTDAPGAERIRLRFSAEIRVPIEVRPRFRFAMRAIEGEPSRERLLLRRTDGKPLTVRKTRVPVPGFTAVASAVGHRTGDASSETSGSPTPMGVAKSQKPIEPAPGDVWLDLVQDASVPAGRYTGMVRLATDHPDAPEIEIPYSVVVRPLVQVRPDVVRLWTAVGSNDPGRSTIVTLTHHGSRKFSVTSIEVSHPDLLAAKLNHREPSTQQSLRLGLAAGLDAESLGGSVEGWVRLGTDDPEKPLVEVPFLIAPNRRLSQRPLSKDFAKEAVTIAR